MEDRLTNLNHDRPILKLIDDLRRERTAARQAGSDDVAKMPIGRGINAVKRSGTAPRDRDLVHQCALKVLAHAARHSDVRVCTHLLNVVSDHKSKSALMGWLTAYGPLSFSAIGEVRFEKNKSTKLGEAALSPYWTLFPKSPKKSFDPISELDKVLRNIKKNEAKGDIAGSSYRSIITDLDALIRRHS